MNGSAVTSSTAAVGNIAMAWSVVGTGDFNGDGKSDIVWRDSGGNTSIWLMNGASRSVDRRPRQRADHVVARRRPATTTATARATSCGATRSGNAAIWFMNGVAISSSAGLGVVSTAWAVQSANSE